MKDDNPFERRSAKPLFIIAEVTRGQCKLNGPWVSTGQGNINYVLDAIGAFPHDQKAAITADLYEHCVYPVPTDQVRESEFQLIAVGKSTNEELGKNYPHLLQLTLDSMLSFMHQRFKSYRSQKRDHEQWDCFGRTLWAESSREENDFVREILERT